MMKKNRRHNVGNDKCSGGPLIERLSNENAKAAREIFFALVCRGFSNRLTIDTRGSQRNRNSRTETKPALLPVWRRRKSEREKARKNLESTDKRKLNQENLPVLGNPEFLAPWCQNLTVI